VEFGSSREMARLRQLMTQWPDEVGSANGRLEARIRVDITKASNELKRLNRWKEFYESPVVFGSRIVAGQIPIISNVVSLMDGASWAFERWTTRRNCWVALRR
jgi:hypothetical protein